jgi:hypothetical protein
MWTVGYLAIVTVVAAFRCVTAPFGSIRRK